ncbi:MAG: hypothetical protein GDA51_00825 [Ekhidna sp.]|nr:hypothetical protein [Ekhidna sp.]
MKNIVLPFLICFILPGCNDDNTVQQENLITENATVWYLAPCISSNDNYIYAVNTEKNNLYIPENFFDEKFRQDNLKIKITFLKTEKSMECGGFIGISPIIKIVAIEKI